jgi:aspartyl-tRNA(Asn)/glutamyl-tRNA(Gln) amidotransferase subunit B
MRLRSSPDTLAPAGEANAKLVANWVHGRTLGRSLNREEKRHRRSPVAPNQLAGLIKRIADGTCPTSWPSRYSKHVDRGRRSRRHHRGQGSQADVRLRRQVERIIDEVLAANAKSVEEFRAGKEKAFNALVGQVMKATKGKANPAQVNDLLKAKLAG